MGAKLRHLGPKKFCDVTLWGELQENKLELCSVLYILWCKTNPSVEQKETEATGEGK